MDNPFLRPFRRADLQIKTRAQNLFWISVIMSVVMGALSWALYTGDAPLSGTVSGAIALLLLLIPLFLRQGWYKTASYYLFMLILVGTVLSAFVNRTGVIESDIYQAIVMLSIGLALLTLFGHSSWLTAIQGLAGIITLVVITYLPPDPSSLNLTVSQLNTGANPHVIWVLFFIMGIVGIANLFQSSQMLKGMKSALETIEANNMVLEDMVEDRTQALRAILDNTGQGFFTFGSDFSVEPEYSRGCTDIFGRPIAGEDVVGLLFPTGGDNAREFRQGLELFFKGKSRGSVIFDLLEKETWFSGKSVTLDYKEAGKGRILVIMTDVTAQRLLEEKNTKEEERRTLIFRALNNKHFFAAFQEEAGRLFEALEPFWMGETTREDKEGLLRQIHTFKGNSGFFGFYQTQETAHDFEYALSDSLVLGDEIPFQDLYFDLKKSFYSELRTISDILGQEWLSDLGGIVISRRDFSSILSYMKQNYAHEGRMIHFLDHFGRIPLRDLFSRFPYIAQATAEKLGKKIKPMIFEVEEVRVSPDRLGTLAEVCVHLVNNMVDHGIEAAYERQAAGKPSEGQLSLKITLEQGLLQLVFQDDGRGIDIKKVAAAARAKSLIPEGPDPSEREVLALLFADGFSTKSEVSEISGRGVGLAAVQEEVRRLGGAIDVQTRLGKGTTFVLSFPLRKQEKR